MAKVFISFLGTSPYSKVTYVYNMTGNVNEGDGVVDTCTRFVQVALVNSLCSGWRAEDKIIVFRTNESNQDNWQDSRRNGFYGLKKELTDLLNVKKIPIAVLNPGEDQDPEKYIIPVGFHESELWNIFSKVYDSINDGDEIYFDMTHAFRTIPLFTTVLFNYCRFMKNTIVESVHYGAYESIFQNIDRNVLAAMKEEERSHLRVPLIDLTSVIKLQAVNEAVSNFRQFGDMGSIVQILNSDRERLDTEDYIVSTVVEKIKQALEQLNYYSQTANLSALLDGEYFRIISEEIGNINDSSDAIPHPEKVLINKIYNELIDNGFVTRSSYINIEAAIKWLCSKMLIQQAVTLASEYIQETYLGFYEDCNYDISTRYDENKKVISYLLNIPKKLGNNGLVPDSDQWRANVSALNRQNAARCQNQVLEFINYPVVERITGPYHNLKNLRNALNHASDTELGFSTLQELKDYFWNIWTQCLSVMASFDSGSYDGITRASIWRED